MTTWNTDIDLPPFPSAHTDPYQGTRIGLHTGKPPPVNTKRVGPGLRIKLSAIKHVPGSRQQLAQPYVFQNPPMDDVAREYGHEHTKYRTFRTGEFSRRGGRNLKVISFKTLAMLRPADWVLVPQQWDMDLLTHRLIHICEAGYPFHLLATHRYGADGLPEFEFDAVIETLRVTETAGEGDARYFDLGISEWRDPVVESQGLKPTRRGGKEWPKYVVLRKNGSYHWPFGKHPKGKLTLAIIAKYAYGAPTLWRQIRDANDLGKWGAHDALIKHKKLKKGGKIKVPEPRVTAHAGGGGVISPGLDSSNE